MDWSAVVESVVAKVGGTAVVALFLWWLARLVIRKSFDAGLEGLKAELKVRGETEIANTKHEFARQLQTEKLEHERQLQERQQEADRARDELQQRIRDDAATRERVREEIQRWANPAIDAVRSLEHRLDNILTDGGWTALDPAFRPPPDWSADHDYFLYTTMFVVAQYLCWARRLELELSAELLRAQGDEKRFVDALIMVSKTLGDYPPKPPFPGAGPDRQLFRVQQQAIGELMATRGRGARGCIGYAAFRRRLARGDFDPHAAPLRDLLLGLKPNDQRYARLGATHVAIRKLEAECSRVLRLPKSP